MDSSNVFKKRSSPWLRYFYIPQLFFTQVAHTVLRNWNYIGFPLQSVSHSKHPHLQYSSNPKLRSTSQLPISVLFLEVLHRRTVEYLWWGIGTRKKNYIQYKLLYLNYSYNQSLTHIYFKCKFSKSKESLLKICSSKRWDEIHQIQ